MKATLYVVTLNGAEFIVLALTAADAIDRARSRLARMQKIDFSVVAQLPATATRQRHEN